MSLGAETGSLILGLLCTWALKENGTSCQLLFQYPTDKIHAEIARLLPGGREIFAFWMPSLEVHSLKLLAFCTAHLTQQTRNERVLGEAFSIYSSHPVICHDLRDTVHSLCQSSKDNLSGEL